MQANASTSYEANRWSRRRGHIPAMIVCALALTVVFGCNPGSPSPATPTHTQLHIPPPLQFSPATLPDAQVGSPYAATITVSETVTPVGDAWVSAGALPAGLDLALVPQHDTINISGTPAAAGTFRFSIYVWCYGTSVNGQTATHEYTLVVK